MTVVILKQYHAFDPGIHMPPDTVKWTVFNVQCKNSMKGVLKKILTQSPQHLKQTELGRLVIGSCVKVRPNVDEEARRIKPVSK